MFNNTVTVCNVHMLMVELAESLPNVTECTFAFKI